MAEFQPREADVQAVDAAPGEWWQGDLAPEAAAVEKPPSAGTGVADRLRQLEELKDGGLITDSEYQEKRKQILEEL